MMLRTLLLGGALAMAGASAYASPAIPRATLVDTAEFGLIERARLDCRNECRWWGIYQGQRRCVSYIRRCYRRY